MKMVVIVGSVLVVLGALAAIGSREDTPGRSPQPVDAGVVANDPSTRPGDPTVYARIEGLTDCVELQREFDIAISNAERLAGSGEPFAISSGYADAAYNRAREVGCYG